MRWNQIFTSKIIENIASQERNIFDSQNKQHIKWLSILDEYTAVPDIILPEDLKHYLRNVYKNRSGYVELYRSLVSDSLDTLHKIFPDIDLTIVPKNIALISGPTQYIVTYTRPKESSWTKSLKVALTFHEDMDEKFNIVVRSNVKRSQFLLDVEDLGPTDLEYIMLEDQKEVIVDQGPVKCQIIQFNVKNQF